MGVAPDSETRPPPRLRELGVMADGSCKASFADGTILAFGPAASSFELVSPVGERARQLTSCCVRRHVPYVREALGYRNRLVDAPVLHWHLLTPEQQRACAPRAAGAAVVRWPSDLRACPRGHVSVALDGSVHVASLDRLASLTLAPARAHVRVSYRALVLAPPALSDPTAAAEPDGAGRPAWARAERDACVPWTQVFPLGALLGDEGAACAPTRWAHALHLALAAAAASDEATEAGGRSDVHVLNIETGMTSLWRASSAALLAGLDDEATGLELGGRALARHQSRLELADARRAAPGAAPHGAFVSTPLPAAATLATRFERTPLSPTATGGGYVPSAPQLAHSLRADCLFSFAAPRPAARSVRAADGGDGARALDALVFADESVLRLETSGALWQRVSARADGRVAPPQRFGAGAVPAVVGTADGAARVELGGIAAEGEKLWRRARALRGPPPQLAPLPVCEALARAHASLALAACADERLAEVEVAGVAQLVAFADGHTVSRFVDRTVLTLHARAPGEAEADRAITAVLADGSYVVARAGLPVGVREHAALVCHFDAWARASEAGRGELGRMDVERSSAIAAALGGTERLLRMHSAAVSAGSGHTH